MFGPVDLESLFGTASPVALITGSGAPRIGRCVAESLASRGYRIVVHANSSISDARKVANQLSKKGVEAIALSAEIRDENQVTSLVTEAHEHFGRIDVLVNGAAVWNPRALENTTADDVRENFEVNALGTFLFCQTVGLIMAQQPCGGAIINIGDWATVRPYLDYSAYFASKGAVPTVTRDFAVELAHRNPRVRVNAVLPGPVMLPPDLPDAERQAAIDTTLVRREGSPHNVAHAVVFLAENDFVTGVCVPVDGGRSIYAG